MKTKISKFLLSKWTLIIAGALVLAAAATVTAINWNNWFGGDDSATGNLGKELYWNVDLEEYAFKSQAFTSARKVDKDDNYYHVLFTDVAKGRAASRRVKDKKIVDKIDTMRVMGLVFDSKGIIVDAVPIEEMGYNLNVRTQFLSQNEGDDGVLLLNSSDSQGGEDTKLKINSTIKKIDVCGVSGEIGTPIDKLVEGDQIYLLSDSKTDKLKYIFVVNRLMMKDLYYNVDRKWDSKLGISTRKVSEDGLYHFNLSVNGEQKDFVTNSPSVATKIDSTGTRIFGLDLAEDGKTIKQFVYATSTTGGSTFGSWYYVSAVDGQNIVAYKKGTNLTVEGTMARNCRVFDVHKRTGHIVGEYSTVGVGDRIHGLTNGRGQIVYVYIVEKKPKVIKVDYCPHCKQQVEWIEYTGGGVAVNDRHYILTKNLDDAAQFGVGYVTLQANIDLLFENKLGNRQNVVLDLNGYKLAAKKRAIAVGINSSFTLMDRKGGGVITSNTKDARDTGLGVWVCNNGKFDMLSGTIDMKGAVNMSYGTGVYVNAGGTFNMHGGTIKNGVCQYGTYKKSSGETAYAGGSGGNVYIATKSTLKSSKTGEKLTYNGGVFNMYGGEIKDGVTYGKAAEQNGVLYSTSSYGGNVAIGNTAVFNLYGGKISGGVAQTAGNYFEAQGGNINISSGGIFNMSGGVVANGKANDGGNISMASSTSTRCTISGGTITGGNASYLVNDSRVKYNGKSDTNYWGGSGGNIYCYAPLEIKGGTITGGTSNAVGGNLAVRGDNGKVVMTGGEITNGVVTPRESNPARAFGGNVHLYSTAKANMDLRGGYIGGKVYVEKGDLKVSGSPQITGGDTNLFVANGYYLKVGPLSGAKIGVTGSGKFAVGDGVRAADYIGAFYPDDPSHTVMADAYGDLMIGNHYHCECGGNCSAASEIGHTCDAAQAWKPLTSTTLDGIKMTAASITTALKEGGNFYLADNTVWPGNLMVNEGKTLNICLNGFTFTSQNISRPLTLNNGGNRVNFCDCSITKTGKMYLTGTNNSAFVLANAASGSKESDFVFNWYGGTLDGSGVTAETSLFNISSTTGKAIVNILGGKIIGPPKTTQGGVYKNTYYKTDHASVINVYGGEIDASKTVAQGTAKNTNGKATAIYSYGDMNIYGGTVIGGTAKQFEDDTSGTGFGGTIYLGAAKSILNISGGKVVGGTAYRGGAIATNNAGSIINITGGEIVGGNAEYAGAIYGGAGAAINMSGGKITGGKATSGGAIYTKMPLNLSGNAVITGGYATSVGGNIYMSGKALTISDNAVIEGGTSDNHGGNIYSNNVININGGEIKDGKGKICGNISANGDNSKIVMTAGTVKDGVSKDANRGNIYIWNTAGITTEETQMITVFDMSGGIITATKDAPDGYFGGGVYLSKTASKDGKFYNSTMKVSGTAKIIGNKGANIYLATDKYINTGVLDSSAEFGISMATIGRAVTGDGVKATDYINNFKADNVNNVVVAGKNDDIYLESEHQHCVCGENCEVLTNEKAEGYAAATAAHTCDESTTWLPITSTSVNGVTMAAADIVTALKNGGNYYIDQDNMVWPGNVAVNNGKVLNICFNGKTVKYDGSSRPFTLNNGTCDINFCDCTEGKKGKFTTSSTTNNTFLLASDANSDYCFNWFGGTLDASGDTDTSYLMMTSNIKSGGRAIFSLYDGKIVPGKNTKQAGVFYDYTSSAHDGQFNVYGGVIDASATTATPTAANNGGKATVAASAYAINIHGGKVLAGTVKQYSSDTTGSGFGGAFYLGYVTSTYTQTGGTVYAGKAYAGGAIATNSSKAKITISGGVIDGNTEDNKEISGGNATSGGLIYSKSPVEITGGTLKNGHATGTGGNIYMSSSTLTVSDKAVITAGNAKNHGGNIYSNNVININGGEISEGVSESGGGNISANGDASKVVMTAGIIKDGISKTKENRGNLYLWNTIGATKTQDEKVVVFDMSGGEITATHAVPDGYFGGGVFLTSAKEKNDAGTTFYNPVMNVSGSAKIYDNKSTGNLVGSNLYLATTRFIINTVGTLTNEAKIGVTMATPGVFSNTGKDYAATGQFVSDNATYSVAVSGEGLKLTK